MMRGFFRFVTSAAAIALLAYGMQAGGEWSDRRWLGALAIAGLLLCMSWWPRTRGLPIFNRTLLRWSTIILVAFALISVQLLRVQIVQSSRTVDRVEVAAGGEVVQDPRQRVAELGVRRGSIFDRNGNVLVESVETESGFFDRIYHEPTTAGLIGYYSPLLFGSSQIEAQFDEYLSGRSGGNPVEEWFDDILHRDQEGYDLNLSLDVELQRIASEQLAGRPGAVVLMDAGSGEVLAMAGAPEFDPNQLYAADGVSTEEDINAVRAYWEQLTTSGEAPLLFRPAQGQYTPGSTFKMVTASAAIGTGTADATKNYRDEGSFEVDGRVIIELNRPDPNRAIWSFEEAFSFSLNVVFAQVGLELGGDVILDWAQRFGFGDEIPFDVPTNPSDVVSDPENFQSRPLVADTGFGQGEIIVTPLQMALVTAAIANEGEIMRPHVVSEVREQDGELLERFGPRTWKRALEEDTASAMRDLMLASADYGFASGAQIDGVTVGGKTGTAETGDGEPHAWFTGFAEGEDTDYVVAVIVEHGGSGGETALPIGRTMLAEALARAEASE